MKKTAPDSVIIRSPVQPLKKGKSVFDWVCETGDADRVIRDLEMYVRRRRRRRVGASATCLAAILIGGTVWRSRQVPVETVQVQPVAASATLLPEMRRLPDGTTVELKAGAEIAVDFSAPLRRVALHNGEAYFGVARDPRRPFVVTAAGVEIKAVGTAFSVQLGQTTVEVLVTEGQVAVRPPAAKRDATAAILANKSEAQEFVRNVGAGESATISLVDATPASVKPVSSGHLAARLVWRVPRLEFAGTPLADAIVMFNQHGRVRLVLGDESLGRLQLSGVLRADNCESLLRLLEGEFGIKAEHRDTEIVLRK